MIHLCHCGCGKETSNPYFVHGHNRATNPRFNKAAWSKARNKTHRRELNDRLKLCRNDNPHKMNATPNRRLHLRKYQLKQYGLTLEDYDALLKAQDGLCAICHKPERKNPSLSVDHNHITGKVRGLLCDRCNRVLGAVEDTVEILRSAIDYLTPKQEDQRDPDSDGPDHIVDEIDDDFEPAGGGDADD
jgi:hypothetical protein